MSEERLYGHAKHAKYKHNEATAVTQQWEPKSARCHFGGDIIGWCNFANAHLFLRTIWNVFRKLFNVFSRTALVLNRNVWKIHVLIADKPGVLIVSLTHWRGTFVENWLWFGLEFGSIGRNWLHPTHSFIPLSIRLFTFLFRSTIKNLLGWQTFWLAAKYQWHTIGKH